MIAKLSIQRVLAGLQRPQATSSGDARTVVKPRRQDAKASSNVGPSAQASFEQQVRQGVAAIQPDDPRRRQRALRVLIEASLLREFGEDLASDPAFHAVVDQVFEVIDEDTELAGTVSRAMDTLFST